VSRAAAQAQREFRRSPAFEVRTHNGGKHGR
jgi:hypothetical protein